jgi:hypothetical protein
MKNAVEGGIQISTHRFTARLNEAMENYNYCGPNTEHQKMYDELELIRKESAMA